MLLEPADQFGLREGEGKLYLVDDWLDATRLEEFFGAANGKVRDTNVLYDALVDKLLELSPDLDKVFGGLEVEEVLARSGVLLGVAGELASGDILGDESNVPVHEVQVEVLDIELVECVLDSLADMVVVEFEELGGNPDFLTRNTGKLDTLTDLVLVLSARRFENEGRKYRKRRKGGRTQDGLTSDTSVRYGKQEGTKCL